MSFGQRLQEIRDGFERPFWVANVSEIFERLSYYGAFSSLAVYLQEKLNFSTEQTGTLTGIFGGMVWFLAIFGGAIADKLGFRRALSMAYLILAAAYFLIGSIGASWLAPVRAAVPLSLFVGCILILPALGIALVKPSVVGTTARASKENVRSIGYSIYYTMVNIGGTAGPFVADWAHTHFGLEWVFRISALSVFAMFFFVLFFFRDPRKPGDVPPPSLIQVARNFRAVLWPPRFLIFLLIFTGYWIVFWQQYTSLPGFIHSYVNADAHVELILITDAAVVVCRILAHPVILANGSGCDFFHRRAGSGRNHSAAALLRLHIASGASRPARHVHGVCVSADWNRLAHRRLVWWTRDAPLRRSRAPSRTRVVDHQWCRFRNSNLAFDLRSNRQPIGAAGTFVNSMDLQEEG